MDYYQIWWYEGAEAYKNGVDINHNPYSPLTEEFANQAWQNGWLDAYQEGL